MQGHWRFCKWVRHTCWQNVCGRCYRNQGINARLYAQSADADAAAAAAGVGATIMLRTPLPLNVVATRSSNPIAMATQWTPSHLIFACGGSGCVRWRRSSGSTAAGKPRTEGFFGYKNSVRTRRQTNWGATPRQGAH
jgi:hypothetical protein